MLTSEHPLGRDARCPRLVGFVASILSLSVFMAVGVLWASQGKDVLEVAFVGFPTWLSYLIAHYLVTGRFVDTNHRKKPLTRPSSYSALLLAGVGGILMVAAVPVGILGMHERSLLLTSIASASFMIGYSATHYAVTGLLL